MEVIELGCIESLCIPDGWVERVLIESIGNRGLKTYHPVQYPQVRFCSYLHPSQLSLPSAESFEQILYGNFHDLSAQEIQSLKELLHGVADETAFSVQHAATGYLCDRRVIKIQGSWINTMEKSLNYFVDLRGDGKFVHEIYYIAPATEFEAFQFDAETIFLSIKWHLHKR